MAITKVSRNLLNTGVSDSSDATAITITSDEKVGVGVTTPENYTFGTPLAISAPSGANSGLTIVSASNSNGTIAMADGTSGVEAYRGFLQYSHVSDAMFIGANGATVIRLDSDGLKFGSDSAAANALDDYEEGTFDAHIRNAGNDAVLVSATGNGKYIKIGRFVFVTIQIYQNGVSSTTLSSSNNYIQMPFTSANSSTSDFNATGFYPMYYAGIGNIKSGYLSSNTNRLFLCTNRDIPLGNLAGTEVVGGFVRLYGDLVYMAES